jgi:hypothetical protein
VELLYRIVPDCAAVKTTVAPTSPLARVGGVIPALKTGFAVKVDTPVKVLAPPTVRVAAVPDKVTGSFVKRPLASLTAGT